MLQFLAARMNYTLELFWFQNIFTGDASQFTDEKTKAQSSRHFPKALQAVKWDC